MLVAKLTVQLVSNVTRSDGVTVRLAIEESGGVLTLREIEGGPAHNRDGDRLTATERFHLAEGPLGSHSTVTIDVEAP